MNAYRTPGVYIEERSVIPPSVAAVATAIPAFIGYTEDATLADTPTRISSLLEYEEKFGGSPLTTINLDVTKRVAQSGALLGVDVSLNTPLGPVPAELLHYSVRHYFTNGGGPCWIYSLGAHGGNVEAEYTAAISALEAIDEPTLLVFPGAVRLAAGGAENVITTALTSSHSTQDRFTIGDVPGALPGGVNEDDSNIGAFRTAISPTDPKALQYGAVYWPYLNTRIPWNTDNDSVTIATFTHREIQDDGSAPVDSAPLNVPVAISDSTVANDETAVFNAARSFVASQFVTLPPSGAVAGAYATIDRNRGVWKAPANIGLAMVSGPAVAATNDLNDVFNVDQGSGKSINVIRSFTGRGIRVWGARTLAGNDNEYRYVPVRRLTIMIEESIEKAVASFVFESNDANTWVRLRTMIENFLIVQWRAGALQGEKPEHALTVRVGLGVTMTPDDILNGILRVSVGIAPVRPAEFIIITIEQKLAQS